MTASVSNKHSKDKIKQRDTLRIYLAFKKSINILKFSKVSPTIIILELPENKFSYKNYFICEKESVYEVNLLPFIKSLDTQPGFICSKLTIETLE